MSEVIDVEQVTVRYGRQLALDRVSFTAEAGSTVALLGRNGAGKSSLVRCLLGQQRPDAGRVSLFGCDAWRDRRTLMDRVGVVPEEVDLPPDMTAADLVALCRSLYRRWDTAAVRGRLQRLEVPLTIPSGRLSRGQKAQLALVLALGHAPELLVLDDPTLGLDSIARRDFFGQVIDEMAGRGVTTLIASHDLAGIEGIADRVVILNGARVVLDDGIEAVKAAFRRLPNGSAALEDIFTAVIEQGETGGLPPEMEDRS